MLTLMAFVHKSLYIQGRQLFGGEVYCENLLLNAAFTSSASAKA